MNIYNEVIRGTRARGIRGVAPCHVAHVLSHHGLTTRIAANRINPANRVKPCPPSKWKQVEDILRELGKLK